LAKKIKYGTVEIPPEEFLDENITALVSLKIPMTLLKDLRRQAKKEKYKDYYQLIEALLVDYVAKHSDQWDNRKSARVTPKKRYLK
jgi:hypothetical protein